MNMLFYQTFKLGIDLRRLTFLLSLVIFYVNLYAQSFTYEYEGNSIVYYIIDEELKTCGTYPGINGYPIDQNRVSGELILPANPKNDEQEYTLIRIGSYGFSRCAGLTSVVIPNSVTSIGASAFIGCSGLTSISIPESVLSIEENAFSGCTGLEKAEFSSIEHLLSIQFNYNASNPLTNAHHLFIDGVEITNVVIPDDITSVGKSVFSGCSSITSIEIPKSVVSICESSFSNCSGLISVNVPNSVTSIDSHAFSGCSSLTSVSLPDSLTMINPYMFRGCKNLTKVDIPETVTQIGTSAFEGCELLSSIILPNSVTTIGAGAFMDCKNMKYVSIGSSITTIYAGAFEGCVGLTKAEFASIESICNIDYQIFWSSGNLTSNPLYYAHNLFIDGQEIKHLIIPESVKSICHWAFVGCSGLDSIEIPETLRSIGNSAFYECSGLSSIIIPNSVETIGEYAFKNCRGIQSIDLSTSVTSVERGVFEGCSGLLVLDLPESITSVQESAFKGCSNLKSVIIPSSVTKLGDLAFGDCKVLNSVTIGGDLQTTGWNVFWGCDNLLLINLLTTIPPCFDKLCFSNYDATVYVPKGCLHKYKTSRIWKLFKEIQEMGNLTVRLSHKDLSLICGETCTISSDITMDDNVSILSKGWKTSDTTIATVEDGVVTAVGEGETMISFDILDRFGRKFSEKCLITVSSKVLVEGIVIKSDVKTLKKKRTSVLTAEITPANATEKSIVWSSSDNNIATIDDMGMVTAIATGNVTITASSKDGSGITASFEMSILPPSKGDSNDDDYLLIDDAVRTANFAIGNEVAEFCFEAADVNDDGVITIGDASGTITEILNQPVQRNSKVAMNMGSYDQSLNSDSLVINDFNYNSGEVSTIEITLDNSTQYVALQADILASKDMKIVGVEEGPRAANHSLIYRRINDNTVRIILFDPNNSTFLDSQAPLLRLNVMSDDAEDGYISITNIHASDAFANEYKLLSDGCCYSITSSVEAPIADSSINIESTLGEVSISNAEGKEISIFKLDGVCVDRFIADNNIIHIRLGKGAYIVNAGNSSAKILIK